MKRYTVKMQKIDWLHPVPIYHYNLQQFAINSESFVQILLNLDLNLLKFMRRHYDLFSNQRNPTQNRLGGNPYKGPKKPRRRPEKEHELLREYEAIKNDKNLTPEYTCQPFTLASIATKNMGELFSFQKKISKQSRKKMHKLFMNVMGSKAGTLTLTYSRREIAIFFKYREYYETLFISFEDVIKANHMVKNFVEQQFIFGIYNKLYSQVPTDFQEIGKWGFYQSKQRSTVLGFSEEDYFSSKISYRVYFVHLNNEGLINFSIVNHRHDVAPFKSTFIQQRKNVFPEYYQIFLDFKHMLIEEIQEQQDWNFRGFGQLNSESDQEQKSKPFQDEKIENMAEFIKRMERQIEEYLKKDLEIYRDRVIASRAVEAEDEDTYHEQIVSDFEEWKYLQGSIEKYMKIVGQETEIFQLMRKSYQKPQNKICYFEKTLRKLKSAYKELSSSLPIFSFKTLILQHLQTHNLTIIKAQTGSGKSTQLPQILSQFYDLHESQISLPILITQPSKLATRTLSQRVAEEMGQKIHGFVDYQASVHSRSLSSQARIIFKLDRLVVQQLSADPLLNKYSCIVIDEAHERTLSIDIILGAVKNIMQKRPKFRVIVTSASLESDLFTQYFDRPLLEIPGRMYKVNEYFCEMPKIKTNKQKIYKLFKTKLFEAESDDIRDKYHGHILIFCSGVEDIMETMEYLKPRLHPKKYKLLALHARLTPNQQKQAFKEVKAIKIILATSFAETSITINGIKVVIDTGFVRQTVYDHSLKMYTINQKKISASSAQQRAGRAGRTSQGYCFRLYSSETKQNMQKNKLPEILNISLDSLVLRLKALHIKEITAFPYITHPGVQNLQSSVNSMKMIECLNNMEQLTEIGAFLSSCPIQPLIGRVVVQAIFYKEAVSQMTSKGKEEYKIKMSDENFKQLAHSEIIKRVISILAVIVNSANIFTISNKEDRQKCFKIILKESEKEDGDFFYLEKIYNQFMEILRKEGESKATDWAKENLISHKALLETRQTQLEIRAILRKAGINLDHFSQNIEISKQKISKLSTVKDCLLACLASSFLSNLSLYSDNPQIGYTMMSQQIPIQLSNSCVLSVHGAFPKWVLCYNLYPNELSQIICKIAHRVDFDLLQIAVSKQVMSCYGLGQANKKNPFYETLSITVPSRVFGQFIEAYKNRSTFKHLRILQKYNMIANSHENKITIFSLRKCKEQKQSDTFSQLLNFIQQIKQKYNTNYIFEYLGNIQVNLEPGLVVKSMQLQTTRHIIKTIYDHPEIGSAILEQLNHYQDLTITRFQNRIKIQIISQQNRKKLKQFLQKLSEQVKDHLKIIEDISNEQFKLPKYILTVKFYTSEVEEEDFTKVYLNYHPKGFQHFQKATRKNYAILMEAQTKLIKMDSNELLRDINIKKSKTQTGINFYYNQAMKFDEVTLQKLLKKYQDSKILSDKFEFPFKFMVFRKPVQPYSTYSVFYWEKILREKLSELGASEDSYSLKLRGWKKANKGRLTNEYTDFTATIQSFNKNFLDQFTEIYDQSRNCGIGIDLVHSNLELFQNVGFVQNNIFLALKQEYLKIVEDTKTINPELAIEASEPKIFKTIYRVFIRVKGLSNSRKAVSEPIRKLRELFKPKVMQIQQKWHFMFDKQNPFTSLLITDLLEEQYNFKIYFIFDKLFSSLYIYAPKQLHKELEIRIEKAQKEQNASSGEFSYKGISLQSLESIIQGEREEILKDAQRVKQNFCVYDINYEKKNIILTADPDTFQKLKAQIITAAYKQEDEECMICCGALINPYRLLNCKHDFCKSCLSKYIKQEGLATNTGIKCPMNCGEFINNYDSSYLLEQDEFRKVCEKVVTNYAIGSQQYHICFTPDCPQIISAEQIHNGQYFECSLCGIEYCMKCKNSHGELEPCFDDVDSWLKHKNVKRCPKCSEILQKISGCNHMTCPFCKSHICWNCLQYYKTPGECYDHLRDVHGGHGGYLQDMVVE